MKEIKFWYLFIVARMRGIGRAYSISPKGNSVSCGIHKINEIRLMHFKHGWVPYCITSNSSSFSCR
jgi:hypothetical protein